jgi:hypothetical protein
MDLDTKAVRETILWFIDLAYKASNEAVAHEVALAFLKAADPAAGRIFDQFLEQSRKNPSPLLHARYQEARDTVEKLLREEKVDAALEFLKNWNPPGPIQ